MAEFPVPAWHRFLPYIGYVTIAMVRIAFLQPFPRAVPHKDFSGIAERLPAAQICFAGWFGAFGTDTT